jgi:uncharacterized protein (DUF305 family)
VKGSLQRADERPREGASPERRGWLFRVPILAAILLVSATAGAALALLFLDRTPGDSLVETGFGMPGEDSAEAGFARDMMVHHAQAVQLAEIVRNRTESEEIRTLAADIALTQQAQIGQMQGWLQVWGLPPTGSEPAMTWMGQPTKGRMPGMASPKEIDDLQKASPEEADVLFLQLMIPHHEAALPMAEAVLERTDRPEVERLAGAIVASQQAEIELMKGLLQRRGVSVEDDSSTPGRHSHGGD